MQKISAFECKSHTIYLFITSTISLYFFKNKISQAGQRFALTERERNWKTAINYRLKTNLVNIKIYFSLSSHLSEIIIKLIKSYKISRVDEFNLFDIRRRKWGVEWVQNYAKGPRVINFWKKTQTVEIKLRCLCKF